MTTVDYGLRTAVDQRPWGGTDHPFAGPSSYALLLTDFYLDYADPLARFEPPFTLAWLYNVGSLAGGSRPAGITPAHPIDLTVKDALGAVVFNSTLASYSATAWGSERTVSQWIGATAVCRIVSRSPQAAEFHIDEEPGMSLSPRTYRRTPARVTGIKVGSQVFTGRVRLQAGYNIALGVPASAAPADGAQALAVMTIDAVPGAGAGLAPACADVVPTIRTIDRVGPNSGGNFIIQADDCLRLQIPTSGGGGELTLASDCQPCCSCEAFVNTYRGLSRMWTRWQALATSAEAARNEYAANVARWTAQAACRAGQPAALTAVQQDPCGAYLGGSFCNNTGCCLAPVEVRFTFSTPPIVLGAELNGAAYAPLVQGPVVRFMLDALNPGQSLAAKLRVRVACNTGDSLTTTLTAHAPDVDGCVQPTAPVDTTVTTAWSANHVPAGDPVRAVETKTSPLSLAPAILPCIS